MQTIELTEEQLHDLAKLMNLAAEQCNRKLYILAQLGMRRTHECNAVKNALRAAMYWRERFEKMHEECKKETVK